MLPCDTSASPPPSLTLTLIECHLAPQTEQKDTHYLFFLFFDAPHRGKKMKDKHEGKI